LCVDDGILGLEDKKEGKHYVVVSQLFVFVDDGILGFGILKGR